VCAHVHVSMEVFFEAMDFIQFYISHLVLMEALVIDRENSFY